MAATRTAVGQALLIGLAAIAVAVAKLAFAEPGGGGLVWRVVTGLAQSAALC
ncbi:hypothetical protein [Amycolatopsis magusensis]|uniref:hypothetical protein n=1 Tax=Amycolatopsis magusensis TaxID=882444 RepID=UPI003788D608